MGGPPQRREIAKCVGLARSTVADYLRRAEEAGLSWPLPEDLDHDALERRLFKRPPPSRRPRALPDWNVVHQELRRDGVTLLLLWDEYRSGYPSGYSYTRFRTGCTQPSIITRQSNAKRTTSHR